MPDVYYNAPYLDETEHAALDHSGIPGVDGGGGLPDLKVLLDPRVPQAKMEI